MGEATEDLPLATTMLAHRLLGGGNHALVEEGKALPRDGRLECLSKHAEGDEHVAQIWSAQERLSPRAHRVPTGALATLGHCAAVRGTDLQRSRHRIVHRMVG